mgnify:FL=1
MIKEYLAKIDSVIENGKYKDTWESLSQYRVPDWYKDSKFGIFIHWGVYSVPAFVSEWYSRNMYIQGSWEYNHHIETYGAHKDFGYKDFIPMFKAEKFSADEWCDLFKQAGAQYIVPVAEHHDGFQMYKSEVSKWNAYEMGPHKDIVGELSESARRHGIVNGASSHRVEHWFFMGHGKEFESDITDDEKYGDFYYPAMPEPNHQDLFSKPTPTKEFLDDWLVRCCEIVDRFQPKIVYFDWWIQHSAVKPYLKKFAAYYYNRAEEWGGGVINYKHDAFMFGCAVVDIERGQFADAKPFIWQTDTAVAKNSWCYTENNDYKSPREIICDLVDIVSKNGRLLLNIGPKADGTIPDEDRHILLEIGKWLSVNGEAIYGSKVWRYSAEGPTKVEEGQFADGNDKNYTSRDIRFTVNNGCLYATVLSYPENGEVCIESLREADASRLPLFHGIIKDVDVLGFSEKPEFKRDEKGLHIKTNTVKSEYPVVFKITVD